MANVNKTLSIMKKASLSTDKHNTLYDVVIVGAGLSGALFALSLLKKNAHLNVLLLDENAERANTAITHDREINENPSFDSRCIALNAGSIDILNELALWDKIKESAQAIEKIQVSDKGYFGALDLKPKSNLNAFGYVVELHHIGGILSHALASFPSLKTFYNVKLDSFEQQLEQVLCHLSNGEVIAAKLCVGADGANSQVRALAKIDSTNDDYRRSAVICNVRSAKPHENLAYERFTKDGPIALLPLTKNRYSLVYCIDNNDVEHISGLSDNDFLNKLQNQFGYRAGVFETTGKRDIYPLSLLKTKRPIAHRVVCIGNAAHTLHPVAGQGFNLGLRDLYVLAKIITDTAGNKIGTFSMLNYYWECRKNDHNKTISMTDGLVCLFSNEYPLLSIPRNIGLQAITLFPFLSHPIINQAKGQFDLFNRENLS